MATRDVALKKESNAILLKPHIGMDMSQMTPQSFQGQAEVFIASENIFLLRDNKNTEVVCMVGVVATWKNPENDRKSGRLAMIFTPSRFRGQGLARLAMSHMLQVLKSDREYQDLYLFTDVKKPAPNKLYKRIGFKMMEDCVLRLMEAK